MPKSLLIFLLLAVLGLGVLTWFQFFSDPATVVPGPDDGLNPDGPRDPRGKGSGLPVAPPVELPRDVPLAEKAQEQLEALKLAMLGQGPATDPADLAWLRNTKEGVAELRALLESSDDEDLKAVILLTLGQSPVEGTFVTLKEAAEGRYGDRLRTAGIISMMGGQAQGEAVRTLRQIFFDTRDDGVASAAIQALSHLDPDQALGAIEEMMGRTQEARRREILYQSLCGHPFMVSTEEPEAMSQFRSGLFGLIPPQPDPTPDQMKVIDGIVDQVVREEDPVRQVEVMVVLARMPGEKARDAFMERFNKAGADEQLGMLGLIHPDLSRGKIDTFLRMAPEMKDRRQRNVLSIQASQWRDPRIVGDLRVWRDREPDEEIRQRLDEAIGKIEGR